jgi:hypothetical protein
MRGQKMIKVDSKNVAKYSRHFRALIADRSTAHHVESASTWYVEGERIALDVANIMGTSLEVGACVISAFSPRERWSSNVAKAYKFANGDDVAGLANNMTMANMSTVKGYDALKGEKTNAFARALAGDSDAVVVDVWMMRAARLHTDSPNKTQYAEISRAVTNVAVSMGISPRTCQALIWILIRGGAE